jgi:hypothetical protein
MWGMAAIYLVAGATGVLVWYLILARSNRQQRVRVVGWIQAALAGKGQVVAVRWLSASVFHVTVRMTTSVFRHPGLLVRLLPREMPLLWLLRRWRNQPATITFEADLDIPPGFNLRVHRHCWTGRTTKHFSPDPDRWECERVTPLIMTSRQSWHAEVTSMMNALLACRDREFLSLGFSRRSPHFSATVALESISPEEGAGSNVFDMLRELAAGASAPRL